MRIILLIFVLIIAVTACRDASEPLAIAPRGMVWLPSAEFEQGAQSFDEMAQAHEKPTHTVKVDGFFIDSTEVTNASFKAFTDATGYITVAERPIDWEELKKQLPPDTPRLADSLLKPGSLVFRQDIQKLHDHHNIWQWWEWKTGANWRHPAGPESNIDGKDNYPVVHIAYADALAYCKWKGHRLPTEAEWERAAHAKLLKSVFTWGDDIDKSEQYANTWQGEFPVLNLAEDGYIYAAPVASYPPNGAGIYDMAGNVWEWTSDWYNHNYYLSVAGKTLLNPEGASEPNNLQYPHQKEKVIKGGSYLCHASYCASFRISARMAMAIDSGSDHLGFRTVYSPPLVRF
ncbi:MAG: formylglycine-generating enzyme family protein [Owenweeksia sp.]